MEGMGDSYGELVRQPQSSLAASSQSSSSSSLSGVAMTSTLVDDDNTPLLSHLQKFKHHPQIPLSQLQALSQNQHQQPPSLYSCLFQQSPAAQVTHNQPRSLLQPNSHSRSVSQPSSFFQTLLQSPSFSQGVSVSHFDGFPFLKPPSNIKDEAADATPGLYTFGRASVDVSMSEQDVSPATSISGHSIPPLPPLSPSPNHYQSTSRRCSTDLNQIPINRRPLKGHRRSHSEVPYNSLTSVDSTFGGPPGTTGVKREGSFDGLSLQRPKTASSHVKKELQWGERQVMEAVGEREGEAEGGDDLFSMYLDVDKIEKCDSVGDVDGPDCSDNGKDARKGGRSKPSPSACQENVKTQTVSSEKGQSSQEVTDSEKEDSEREDDSFMADSTEKDIGTTVDDKQRKGSNAGGSCHSRSASMDSLTHRMQGPMDAQQSSGASQGRQVGHHHSHSIDGSFNFRVNLVNGDFDEAEMKKIMADDKLAELAIRDPKRVKRILANRQSAARSKERKMRYISELEKKVQTLQTEATALSAQLSLMQRDSTSLTNENNELKLRLQAMEQQAQLREALHEALRDELQQLKVATGGHVPGQVLGLASFPIPHQQKP